MCQLSSGLLIINTDHQDTVQDVIHSTDSPTRKPSARQAALAQLNYREEAGHRTSPTIYAVRALAAARPTMVRDGLTRCCEPMPTSTPVGEGPTGLLEVGAARLTSCKFQQPVFYFT